jgi:MFS-type transporter involved in bile tolerance (Atg22 family)
MDPNPSGFSIGSFILGIFRSGLVVFAGFAIAPTRLLYDFYESHPSIRIIAVFAGILTAIWGLCSMLNISLRTINGRSQPT